MYYETKSFPAAMPWKAPRTPKSPYDLNVTIADDETNRITLTWKQPEILHGNDQVEYYSIYNLDTKLERMHAENLFKIIQADKTSLTLSIVKTGKINYFFTVKSLDKFWNESIKSGGVKKIQIPSLKRIASSAALQANPVLVKNNGNNMLIVQSGLKDELKIENESGTKSLHEVAPGLNVIEIDGSFWESIPTGNASKQLELSFYKSGIKTSLRLR
jgi:hypothetical protein